MSVYLGCPKCGGTASSVVDSRPSADGKATRRRRHCHGCGNRWTTYEVQAKEYEQLMPLVDQLESLERLRVKMAELVLEANGLLTSISRSKRIKEMRRNTESRSQYSSPTPYPALVAANQRANEAVARIYNPDARRST